MSQNVCFCVNNSLDFVALKEMMMAAASSITDPSEIALLTENLQQAFCGILELRQRNIGLSGLHGSKLMENPTHSSSLDKVISEIPSSTQPTSHRPSVVGLSVSSNLAITMNESRDSVLSLNLPNMPSDPHGSKSMESHKSPILDIGILEISSSTQPSSHRHSVIGLSVSSSLAISTNEMSGYHLESQFAAEIGDDQQHSFQPLINCGRISDEILQRPRARLAFLVISGFILIAPNIVPYFYESSALLAFYAVNFILAIFIALHVFDRRIAFLVASSWDFLYLGGICLVFSSSTIYQTVLNTNLATNIYSFAPHWVAGIVLLQIAINTYVLVLFASDAAIALSKWHKIVLFSFGTAIGIGILISYRINATMYPPHPICIFYFVCSETHSIQISCMSTLTLFSAKYLVSLLRNHDQMVILKSKISIHTL